MLLDLTEHSTENAVQLSVAERDALRNVRDLNVQPTPGATDCYDVTPGSTIGAFEVGSLSVRISPKIPLDRVLFLLAYTCDRASWTNSGFDFDEENSLVEAIVPGFVRQVQRAVRRGVLQGYRAQDEALTTVRGRVRMNEQVSRRHGLVPPIEIRYDEFTEDIEANRLLKAAIVRLKSLRLRSAKSTGALRSLDATLASVSTVSYDTRRLPDIAWTRLNSHYRPAVELAKLILRSCSFEHRHGTARAAGFTVDMNQVFEDFVVVALREALGVEDRILRQGDARLRLDTADTVRLEPDISWWEHGECRFVGDVKYKNTGQGSGPNADLYQLLSYVVASDLPSGMLIYAAGEADAIVHRVVNLGLRIVVRTPNLRGSPDQILAQVGRLASDISASKA